MELIMNAYMNQYQQTQVTTAGPERILMLLYDGAIRFTGQARLAIKSGEPLAKRESISRALAIVSYLSDTLDHEAGWAGSDELDGLYGFIVNNLTQANLKDDLKALEVVEGLLQGLRDTWHEAIDKVNETKHKSSAAEKPTAASAEVGKPAEYRPLSLSL
jgi:flagellar secretion chaperone FliS